MVGREKVVFVSEKVVVVAAAAEGRVVSDPGVVFLGYVGMIRMVLVHRHLATYGYHQTCLLYTSDAADE